MTNQSANYEKMMEFEAYLLRELHFSHFLAALVIAYVWEHLMNPKII